MIIAQAVGLMVFLGCGLFGWGAAARWAMRLPAGTWPMTVAIGLAVWIAIGGVLNLAHAAYPAVIGALLAAGCGVMVWSLAWNLWDAIVQARTIDPKASKQGAGTLYPAVWLSLAAAITGFAVMTQAAPTMYDYGDDYQRYFGYAVRMVQTGTLAGSPLNTLGAEMGGQAFLHGLFVGYLPLGAINAADAVFCFGLMVLLAGSIALRRPPAIPASLIAMAVVWLLEPQYVNVSALYSGAALTFAAVSLGIDKREYATPGGGAFSSAAANGLIYASLVALKTTFVLFVLLHFLFGTVCDVIATRRVGAVAKQALATAFWGLVFIAPWVALYSPLYWTAFTAPIDPLPIATPVPAVETIDLLAVKPLIYGGSYAEYTFAVATFLLCGAAMFVRYGFQPGVARFAATCIAVPCTYLVMVLAVGPELSGYDPALRHFLPTLIGALPAILVLCAASSSVKERPVVFPRMCAALVAILAFWSVPGFLVRCHYLFRTGSMLAYLRNSEADAAGSLVVTVRDMIEKPVLSQKLAEMQRQVPAGEPLVAWIETPFLLDYSRNPIIDADLAGLANPWSRTPPASYVLWQYAGLGVRLPKDYAAQMQGPGRHESYLTARGLVYASRLQNLLPRVQVVANDGGLVLLRIPPDAGLP
jgi:hypothetical protein